MTLPLAGRVALVTGVSRRRGIGFAIATRLATMGASLFIQHWRPHDADQPWGPDEITDLVSELGTKLVRGARLEELSLDLGHAQAPDTLVDTAVTALEHLDILVCNHAQSGFDGNLAEMTAEKLDRHWKVNTRSTVLATRAFAEQHDGRDGGRVVWLTSGQAKGGMSDEIAYVASKAALAGLTASVADGLIERRIVLNTVNPGPVNTGYLDENMAPEDWQRVLQHFPSGRLGEPDDPARLIAWLVSDEGCWLVGQVLDSEGGFRRW
ncbi:MAG: SDR family oxidoreductase [Marmoricola sp.]